LASHPGKDFPVSIEQGAGWALERIGTLWKRENLVSARNYNTNLPSSAGILVIYVEKQCAKETVYRQVRVVTGQYNIIVFTCKVQIPLNNLYWGILSWLHPKFHKI
jgi:hypothetical protein